jgi:hypothetical protein
MACFIENGDDYDGWSNRLRELGEIARRRLRRLRRRCGD